ncbi:MAG TPA: hypothetical protein EYP73_02545 [Acidimicrobiia bacterium]|nr:hypothetical protein [Acidimicrobiia bacterium]
MSPLPELRVVSLERIRRHEKIDPLRVERLVARIEWEGTQVNPMVCAEAPGEEALVLLDGATRTEAFRHLGLPCAVVQIVEPAAVNLETWHHVIRQCPARELLDRIESQNELSLVSDEGTPRLRLADDGAYSVLGDGVSPNAALGALVDAYMGHWTVNRVTEPDVEAVAWRFPDWSVLVEFPALTIDDVMKAALGDDLLPAGITRFLVSDRALRLNLDLELLRSPRTLDEKQEALEELLHARAREGRIRRYEETVVVLDD